MATINEWKRQSETRTPVLLLECRLKDGSVERWSTHKVTAGGNPYEGRVLRQNRFEIGLGLEEGVACGGRFDVTLVNADGRLTQIERSTGFKGADLTARFVFMDLENGTEASELVAVYRGIANAPEEIREGTMRLTFHSRMSLKRHVLPNVRIQPRCPWVFPATAEQRLEGKDSEGWMGRCGYSADVEGGIGNLGNGVPFTGCNYTRADCEARGMFDRDSRGTETRRFGGFASLPPSVTVRPHESKTRMVEETVDGRGRSNDAIPLVYGTVRYSPPVVMARNDGNLLHCEALLGMGPMERVHRVSAGGVELPLGQAGKDMTGTGWYEAVSLGERNGAFNPHFLDADGTPQGDPHGGMAVLAIAIPKHVQTSSTLPRVEVLADGLRVDRFDESGMWVERAHSRNPAWVLLDVLRRSGWTLEEIDLASFAETAAYCDSVVMERDPSGADVARTRFAVSFGLQQRTSVAEVVRGIRLSCALILGLGLDGRLELRREARMAVQHASKEGSSNAEAEWQGGWPAYEFGDGGNGSDGILRAESGEARIRFTSRPASETVNRLGTEFQNEFNHFLHDSVSVLHESDYRESGQELAGTLACLGLPNYEQAIRVVRLALQKNVEGNRFVEFETSVKGFGLRPGDLITLTWARQGLNREPYRVHRLQIGENFETVTVQAQAHREEWYELLEGAGLREELRGGSTSTPGLSRPIAGRTVDTDGSSRYAFDESRLDTQNSEVALKVGFIAPGKAGRAGCSAPFLSLTPGIATEGGTLAGGSSYYYSVTGLDAAGFETGMSFVVRADVTDAGNTNAVRLRGLTFSRGTARFRVYRGSAPQQLFLIGEADATVNDFVDAGLPYLAALPPDENYHHANFYWRTELMPARGVSAAGPTFVQVEGSGLRADEYRKKVVRVVSGRGAGQERTIQTHDDQTVWTERPWAVQPDSTSTVCIAEPSWQFGGTTDTEEIRLILPGLEGVGIQVVGRAATAQDVETPMEASPMSVHVIGGAGGGEADRDVPPEPVFGLSTTGAGMLELAGIGFATLTNTRSVHAGTLSVYSVDECVEPSRGVLLSAVGEAGEWLDVVEPLDAQSGTMVSAGFELMRVVETSADGLRVRVSRAQCGSEAEAHGAGVEVVALRRNVFVAAFPLRFFGTPASGSYLHAVELPHARIAGAEYFVTNRFGDSPTVGANYLRLGGGLRTGTGGQYCLQVAGLLAVQRDAVPPLEVESERSVLDVRARMREAPLGGPVNLRLWRNGEAYCGVTIDSGQTVSTYLDGAELAPLHTGDVLSMEVVEVPTGPGSRPGRDLTVTLRV
jgi:hypothetical protein